MSTALVTYVEAATTSAQLVPLVVRTKARVATTSGAFCSDQSSEVWFPVAPDTTLPSPPASTTNASPLPPNAVLLPPGTDLSDTCFIFQDLLPLSSAPVYPVELDPTVVLPPYIEEIPLLGITLTAVSIREYPYELTLPTQTVALVTYQRAQFALEIPVSNIAVATTVPVVTSSLNMRLPAADVLVAASAPEVGQLIGTYVEVPSVSIVVEAPVPAVPGSIQLRPPNADIAVASPLPAVGGLIGTYIEPPASDIAVAAPAPTAP